jgi:hypothetical protein
MGNYELKVIAAELVTRVRKSVTIDWAVGENARARIRVMVKRILKKHEYPPDLQDEATKTVLVRQSFCQRCGPWHRLDSLLRSAAQPSPVELSVCRTAQDSFQGDGSASVLNPRVEFTLLGTLTVPRA